MLRFVLFSLETEGRLAKVQDLWSAPFWSAGKIAKSLRLRGPYCIDKNEFGTQTGGCGPLCYTDENLQKQMQNRFERLIYPNGINQKWNLKLTFGKLCSLNTHRSTQIRMSYPISFRILRAKRQIEESLLKCRGSTCLTRHAFGSTKHFQRQNQDHHK